MIQFNQKPEPIDKVVVGLGNPGAEYSGSRHNMGFRALDVFLQAEGIKKFFKPTGKARIQKVKIHGERVLLVRPTTFMNLSGSAVKNILNEHELDLSSLLVIHDEMDIEPGRGKMKIGGSAAGHNGVADIIEKCGEDFARLKIGIGKPESEGEDASIGWVLGKPDDEEEKKYLAIMPEIARAIHAWITDGPEIAMNRFNSLFKNNSESDDRSNGEEKG